MSRSQTRYGWNYFNINTFSSPAKLPMPVLKDMASNKGIKVKNKHGGLECARYMDSRAQKYGAS